MLSILVQKTSFSLAILLIAAATVQAEQSVEKPTARPRIEVCFVLDTTGSMGSLIQGAKDKIWSIANELVNTEPAPQVKFSLVGYRDRGDQYVTQVHDMTDDLDGIHSKLMAFVANGGGDGPESVNQALHEAVTKITWDTDDPKTLKIIFLVGDAPPHMDYDNESQYPEICQNAVRKDLIINTIQCGADSKTTRVWEEIARRSEGSFAAIQQSGGTVAIATPFDAAIAKCNTRMNETICGYGDSSIQFDIKQKIASNEASKAEAIADRAMYFSKRRGGGFGGGGAKAIGGRNDLVELLIDGRVEMDAIKTDQLPGSLQSLSKEARTEELEKRIANRKKTQVEMDRLVKQRSDYIAKEKARLAKQGAKDSFDEKVKDMIRKQAKSKGIEYSKK